MKKAISLIVTLVLLVSMSVTAAAFTDVPNTHWAAYDIMWANATGLMNGMGNDEFAPETEVNRAMLVTVLWRMEKSPAPTQKSPFTDLMQDWYKDPVAWAYENKIVNGMSATSFAPENTLTREQAATIFYNYSVYKGYNTSATTDLATYPDGAKTSPWAEKGLSWANAAALITGIQEADLLKLAPQGNATRAQLATILHRYNDFAHYRYYYQGLNTRMRSYYTIMDEAVGNFQARFHVGTLSDEEIMSLYYAYTEDHPEYFYIGMSCGRIRSDATGAAYMLINYSDGVSDSNFSTPSEELLTSIRRKVSRFESEANRILDAMPEDLSQVEQEKWIYDYILRNCEYDMAAIEEERWLQSDGAVEWSAYGIIVNKKGVCESYAEAFQYLCREVGIECTNIVGYAEDVAHKWNAVRLDNEWYLCDLTFDDPIGNPSTSPRHEFFNCTSAEITTHTVDSLLEPPICTGTKYSYQNYFENE